MRPARFGIVVLVVVFAYFGWLAFRLSSRLFTAPMSHVTIAPKRIFRPTPPRADIDAIKSDLCRIARSEQAIFDSTGQYAGEDQLRSRANPILYDRWPYRYSVRIPLPDRFVIVATAYGGLQQFPPALVVDRDLRICELISHVPRLVHTLDEPSGHWGDVSYECEKCK